MIDRFTMSQNVVYAVHVVATDAVTGQIVTDQASSITTYAG
ncbi:MAG: hypothetical protein QOK39_835 [Acidimicrobiaceae bacterium]|jgi:hypothetical protein|nr:hypothetical protein [Acidimicrobiaceae bacterium]